MREDGHTEEGRAQSTQVRQASLLLEPIEPIVAHAPATSRVDAATTDGCGSLTVRADEFVESRVYRQRALLGGARSPLRGGRGPSRVSLLAEGPAAEVVEEEQGQRAVLPIRGRGCRVQAEDAGCRPVMQDAGRRCRV